MATLGFNDSLVSISFCASHHKGANPGEAEVHPAQAHMEWLEDACCLYRRLGLRVIVAATAFPGIIDVDQHEGNHQRDVLWRILDRGVQVLGTQHNPGHQVGAALAIRIGLEAAGKWNAAYLIHTAEDVMPQRGAIERMLQALSEEGYDYAGSAWGPDRDQLNTQFFACRTQALVPSWDACQVSGDGCIERYAARLLRGRRLWLQEGLYRHTHDRAEWQRWRQTW